MERKIKKLVKGSHLRLLGQKLVTEYMELNNKIENMEMTEENCKEIEEGCIEGLYKQHLTIAMEIKMYNLFTEYDYEKLIDKYEDRLDEYRRENDKIFEAHSKKELIYKEKEKVIDMLSRQFASSEFERIKLMEIAGLSQRDLEKLYNRAVELIENEAQTVEPEERGELIIKHMDNISKLII